MTRKSNPDVGTQAKKKNNVEEEKLCHRKNVIIKNLRLKFEQLSGFSCQDFCSFENFVKLMYRSTDPASLGVVRALFGLCMVVDVVEERGLANVDLKWGEPEDCHFPLVHGMRPPTLTTMILLYGVMWLGAFGIMLGYHFKKACALFVIPYWYIHLLDKSYWNNHSYLYGIVALLFWGTGANRYFALDAKLKRTQEKSVPYWNYFILKFQFFVLYFIAGLKKSSLEWLEGYAMANLSRHWIFLPFRLFLSAEQTDLYIVHWFAFAFDLSVGFFMLFEATRVPAMFFCTAFHLMNSRLFSIGMFPFVCLATMPLFCRVDWPRKLRGNSWLAELTQPEKFAAEEADKREKQRAKLPEARPCPEDDVPSRDKAERAGDARPPSRQNRASPKQKFVVLLLVFHVFLQFFLPYSHFITKGYNNWVPGLYGYSWDMMMHAWDTQLVVVKVRDNQSGKDYFLDPEAWVPNERWAKHGDMVRQYAHCIKDNLEKLRKCKGPNTAPWQNLSSNISIYIDVWCSLNGRFKQRLFDPSVDMLKAEWHPFKPVSYLMPLLSQFSSYRSELERIEEDVLSWSNYTDVLFVADYPGLSLENYVGRELENVTLSVLEGEVAYVLAEEGEPGEGRRREEGYAGWTIGKGGSVRIQTGRFHRVETTGSHPACYMYTFANRTKQQLAEQGSKEETPLHKPAFPLFQEMAIRIDAFARALGHIANVILHITIDVPIIRRISLKFVDNMSTKLSNLS